MTRFHPLHTHLPLPTRLNNPMGYIPHPLCQQAAKEMQRYIASVEEWQEEIGRGKMFGVVVVEDAEGRLGFLAAYSGLLAERNDWPYFVPAVFDFNSPTVISSERRHSSWTSTAKSLPKRARRN